MTVYVDKMKAPLGQMVMCHMLADTSDELHAMADTIGLARKWCQDEGTPREHYDIGKGKRALAIAAGAVEVSHSAIGFLIKKKRAAAAATVTLP